jgi:hypothetical protein
MPLFFIPRFIKMPPHQKGKDPSGSPGKIFLRAFVSFRFCLRCSSSQGLLRFPFRYASLHP